MERRKKIGIVAPYSEPNYGTVLQAYALHKKLKDKDIESEYLRFDNDGLSFVNRILRNAVKLILDKLTRPNMDENASIEDFSFLKSKAFASIRKGYNRFVKENIPFSSTIYTRESLSICNEYDGYLVGSDQTWSEHRCVKNDLYFLKCMPGGSPKYSYAPSIGTTTFSKEYLSLLANSVKTFDFLSCREKSNSLLLSKETGREVTHVLDPTLLLKPKDWDCLSLPHNLPVKGYVLCYILGVKECISKYAENLAVERGLPVYYIATRPKYIKKNNVIYPNPEQFVSLIRDAACVVTDSFHGTIFSINYNVDIFSFSKREGSIDSVDNTRILEILSQVGLQDRFLADEEERILPKIDYTLPNIKLEMLRGESEHYLQMVIEHIKSR